MKKIPKYEVVPVVVPNGTVAGTLIEITDYKPDKDYSYVDGFAVNIVNPGADVGANFVLAGLRDQSAGTIHDDAPVEQMLANAAVEPNKKFKDMYTKCDGRSLKPRVTPTSNATADYTVYFTFRLIDELVEVAQR
jgi:hypothetical protein